MNSSKKIVHGVLISVLAAVGTMAFASVADASANLYVDQARGNDGWSGTIAAPKDNDGPFASLERARDAIRAMKQAGGLPQGGVTVWLRGGIHRRANSGFALGTQDSGTANSPIVYRSYPNERAKIIGGRIITQFEPVTNSAVLNRLPAAARPHVVQANLPAHNVTNYGSYGRRGFRWQTATIPSALEVSFKGKPMTVSRWPNDDYAIIASIPSGTTTKFSYSGDRPKNWATFNGIMGHGYWGLDWADSHEQVVSIDTGKREITMQRAGVYGYKAGQRFYLYNILEELDQPGEYFVDRSNGILYFWPTAPIGEGDVIVSTLEQPLVSMQSVSHVIFRDLDFGYTRGHAFSISGGTAVTVAGCEITNVGNNAVAFTGGTYHNVISNDISYIGDDGILIDGGSGMTGRVATRHTVHNNYIHDFSRWARTYHPAVFLHGAEHNTVTHNHIHSAPHMAIGVWAGNNLFEFNKVHDVVTETADAGAFYTIGRTYGYKDNVIRHNMFHNTTSPLSKGTPPAVTIAVYLDDGSSDNTVFGNVFFNNEYAIMSGGGRNNKMDNNIFIDPYRAIHVDSRMRVETTGVTIRRNIFQGMGDWIHNHGWFRPDYRVFNIHSNIVNPLNGKFVTENGQLVFRFGDQRIPMSTIGVNTDPMFIDFQNGNYQLKDNSPAYGLGFVRIPIEKIGLIDDEFRTGQAPGPALSRIGDQLGRVGEALGFTLSVVNPVEGLVFSSPNLPSGAMLIPETGEFQWTPTADQAGTHTITFNVSDGEQSSTQSAFVVVLDGTQGVPTDPIAWYRMENNANDLMNTFHGVAQGTVSYGNGVKGHGIRLDGSTGNVNLPLTLASATNPSVKPVTVAFWWRPSAVESDTHDEVLIGGFTYHWFVSAPDNVPTAYLYSTARDMYSASSNMQIQPGTWAHIAATYTGNTVKIYVNGQLKNTAPWSGGFTNATQYLAIGRRGNTFVAGDIDEVMVFNRALFDEEVQNIFAAQNPYADNNAPVLNTIGDQSVMEGKELKFTVSGTDPDGDALTYAINPLPQGATFNTTTGAFQWKPSIGQAGGYALTFTVSDGILTDSETINITVEAAPAPPPPPVGSRPIMFISGQEIAAIRAKVQAGDQPWKSAYDQMMANANSALNASALSVVDNGGGNWFRTDDPYTTDGVFNPNSDRRDYSNAITTGRNVRDLGLAYALTGDARYADKAISLIRRWSLNSSTRMNPSAANHGPHTSGQRSGGAIEVYVSMPALFYGADLIWDYPGWDTAEKTAFKQWAQDMGNSARSRDQSDTSYRNNKYSWRLVLIASAAVVAEDDALMDYAVSRFKQLIPQQVNSSGHLVNERHRTTSLSYSLYALNAMVQMAEIARHQGHDLYNYTTNGLGLKRVVDYHAPFTANPNTWPLQQIRALNADETAIFELVHSEWPGQAFLNVINKWNRPMRENRVLGPVTLTHANRFMLDIREDARPRLKIIPNQLTTVGEAVTFNIEVVYEGEEALTFTMDNAPAGASFDTEALTFTWTPAADQEGTHNATFTVSDGTNTDSRTATIVALGDQAMLPPDYLAYWKLDGNATDVRGAHNGTVHGTTTWVEGVSGQAAGLNGTNAYVNLPIALAGKTNPTQNPVTVSMWWKPAAVEGNIHDEVLLGGFSSHWFLSAPNNVPTAYIYNSNSTLFAVSSNETVPVGEWVHVAAVYNTDQTINIYINGELANTGTWSGSFNPATMNFRIGQRGNSFVAGAFDEAIIYQRALFPQEIRNIYALHGEVGNRAPVIAPIDDQMVKEGDTIEFTVSVTDPDGDALTWTVGELPEGALFDIETGAFVWETAKQQAGEYAVIFTVSDGELTASQTVTIIVVANRSPEIELVGDKTIHEGEELQFTVNATDPDGDALTWTASELPEGAIFDTETGAFTWETAKGDIGEYSVTFSVSDGELTASETIAIIVLKQKTQIPGDYLAYWKFDGNATDQRGAFNGTVHGGTNWVEGKNGQAVNLNGTDAYVNLPLDLASQTDPTKTPVTVSMWWKPSTVESNIHDKVLMGGFTYHWFLSVPGNVPTAYLYSTDRQLHAVSSNKSLPVGEWAHIAVVYDTDQTIRIYINGEPANTGSWQGSFSPAGTYFRMGNRGLGNHVGGAFDETVLYQRALTSGEIRTIYQVQSGIDDSNEAPSLHPIGNLIASQGETLEFTISASDPDGDQLAYTADGLPEGASLDAATGAFHWTIAEGQGGVHSVTFTVSDGDLTDSETITIIVPIGRRQLQKFPSM